MLLTVTLRVRINYYHFTSCLVIMWTSRTLKSILTTVQSCTSDDENCDCGVARGGKKFSHLGCEEVVRTLVVSDSEKFLL